MQIAPYKTTFVFIILASIYSCKNTASRYEKKTISRTSNTKEIGRKLSAIHCNYCHQENIAPPLNAIKEAYMQPNSTLESFTKDIEHWIKNPTIQNSKMPPAVTRFGLMPKSTFPKQTIKQIAAHIYITDLKIKPAIETKKSIEELGLYYAIQTKKQLGKNLIKTIKNKGTKAAISFCNARALPITDSMAKVQNVIIKRISDKPRNLINIASLAEVNYINHFKKLVKEQKEINPLAIKSANYTEVFYPIVTNSMCLQCHGKTAIKKSVYTEIKKLYPKDKAIGYSENEVRGILAYSNK